MRLSLSALPRVARALNRTLLRTVAPLWAGALAALAAPAAPAAAQCAPDPCGSACQALWLGDLNNDNLVNQLDRNIMLQCFLPIGSDPPVTPYCECADLNFDGQIDDIDLRYLDAIIDMAGSNNVRKLPRVTLSEVRVRKPLSQNAPGVPESRYVEIRIPLGAASTSTTQPIDEIQAPTVNGVIVGNEDVRRFRAGWYYLKVLRAVPSAPPFNPVSGCIAVVVPLETMTWYINPIDAVSRGLSLVVDGSFAGSPIESAIPATVAPYVFDISPSSLVTPNVAGGMVFNDEADTNVTHMIVFRDPMGSRAIPAVGQRINVPFSGAPICEIAWSVPGSGDTLPPFDAIVDCVTIVRGQEENTYGCIFGDSAGFHIGPVGTVAGTYAPPHIYRCRTAGTWTRGPNAISIASDTPFMRNPTCSSIIQGCGELGPSGDVRDCFEPQSGPSCSDADCCQAVCAIDPSCCSNVWDANCVAQAQITCTTCGLSPSSCFVAHPTPSCNLQPCCSDVCNLDPTCCTVAWSEPCVQLAVQMCMSCGPAAPVKECCEPHPTPYCGDATCCTKVCAQDPFCCNTSWDQICADLAQLLCELCGHGCGSPSTGDCCIVHASPYCADEACCQTVCNLDPFCCETSWDLGCTQLTLVYCTDLDCACGVAQNCMLAYPTPGCSDLYCCQTVCLRDPWCCLVSWDRACQNLALDLCSQNPLCMEEYEGLPVPVLGSCYVPHLTPGCDQPGCCSQVCAMPAFAYCCEIIWDADCAIRASEICDACGEVLAGSCFSEHGSPNCSNTLCCNKVCQVDSFCCDSTWDALCVQTAYATCNPPISSCGTGNTRSCWVPNYTPGCKTISCCQTICGNIDPYCCDTRWDAVCAKQATYFCTLNVTQGIGSCLEPHATTGCANIDCTRAVCSVDPSCCGTAWDTQCVAIASAVCVAVSSCPAPGSCMTAHHSSGCDDPACCSGVCNADPTCCSEFWDTACVNLAQQICRPPLFSNWNCPCQGRCTEGHDNPGCEDLSCCSLVCNIDPTCCVEQWDGACAQYARTFCCGPIGCDSGCNKPCLEPHDEPYCDDPYCCDAVCRVDPLCCAAGWDSLCAQQALNRCAGACGLATAGNCFVPREFPGCDTGACCYRVCREDPVCCNVVWDDVCVELASREENADVCQRTQCGTVAAGKCCQPHGSQGCEIAACCTEVCAQDVYCCEVEWDANCTDIARELPACGCTFDCGDPCAGDCCRAHSNNACDDADCCGAVCLQDSYCCNVEWDAVCASMARSICTGRDDACPVPPCGSSLLQSCCVPGILPNCNKTSCCNAVCNNDPYCCDVQWDSACALLARDPQFSTLCGCQDGGCGDPGEGSCYQTHSTPFCADGLCCETVCAFDILCCNVAWDANCVALAEFFCDGSFATLQEALSERGAQPAEAEAGRRRVPPPGWVPPRTRAVPPTKHELPPGYPRAEPRTQDTPSVQPQVQPSAPASGKDLQQSAQPLTAPGGLTPAGKTPAGGGQPGR